MNLQRFDFEKGCVGILIWAVLVDVIEIDARICRRRINEVDDGRIEIFCG